MHPFRGQDKGSLSRKKNSSSAHILRFVGLNKKFLFPIQFLLSSIPFLLHPFSNSIRAEQWSEENIKNCAIKKDVGRVDERGSRNIGLNLDPLLGRLMSNRFHRISWESRLGKA